MIYANPGNQPQISQNLYIMDIKTHGAENHEIFAMADFHTIVDQYNATKVMFHRTDLPQRALSIDNAQPVMEQLIREELERLKANWRYDPCWDIEHTEGFEQHHDELLKYRLEIEARWQEEKEQKIKAKADELQCSAELAEYILILERRLDVIDNGLRHVWNR